MLGNSNHRIYGRGIKLKKWIQSPNLHTENTSSLKFTVLQRECILLQKSTVRRNVLGVYIPKNQFVTATYFNHQLRHTQKSRKICFFHVFEIP